MTDPVEAIVACPECRTAGKTDNVDLDLLRHCFAFGYPASYAVRGRKTCSKCNGTGLVRIRAPREDVPTIDRVPKEET